MNSERKLRAACDRCHELKNRCTRTCGPEARCDRCERLDIDCVYNTTARMGRPRLLRPVSENHNGASSESNSHARHTKRRAVQTETPRGATTVQIPVDRVDPASAAVPAHNRSGGTSPANPDSIEPVVGFLDPVLLQEVMPGDNLHWDLRLYSPDFAHATHDDPQRGGRDAQEHGYPHQGYQQMESMRHVSKDTSVFSDSGLGDSEKGTVSFVKTTGADKLLRLQSHLSNLLACAGDSHTGNQPALDEVLVACKDLLELLPVSAVRRPDPNYRRTSNAGTGTGTSRTPTGVNLDGCRGICEGTQKGGGQFDPLGINYITVLQIATSYAYALQLLDLSVDRLSNHTGNLALISLGAFNLSPQSAMSTSVGAYMITSMVHELRDAIGLLMPEYQEQHGPPPAPHEASPQSALRPASTAGNNSIQAAVNMVSEKEASLLEKLAQVMANP
ncbi:transcriptional regulator family: Fungal Specific TF [Aspergillus niger]|nr:transcriptional regulator family: Fungal Specific TF [Aspergillus niger]KAI3050350.1 transcriptional regulator family: Fungal Specific TF [Aspergillus niger]